MSRAEYMRRRRRCKKLSKGQLKIERALVALDRSGEPEPEGTRENLMALRDKAATLMELFQLDAWESRKVCVTRGVSLPPPSKSEGKGFQSLTAEDRQRMRRDLEAMTDTNTEALVAQGGG